MSWNRLEAGMPRHPKVQRLAKRLGISRREAIGLLCDLWSWVLQMRPSGMLDGFTAEDIELALDWTGPGGELVGILVTLALLDQDSDGVLEVHGWEERAEGHKRAEAERKRRTAKAAGRAPRVPHACPTRADEPAHALPTRAPDRPNDRTNERTMEGAPLLLITKPTPDPLSTNVPAVIEAWNRGASKGTGRRPRAAMPSTKTAKRDSKIVALLSKFSEPAEWEAASQALSLDDHHGARWRDKDGTLRSDLSWFLDDSKGAIEKWMERGQRLREGEGPAVDGFTKMANEAAQRKRAEQETAR